MRGTLLRISVVAAFAMAGTVFAQQPVSTASTTAQQSATGGVPFGPMRVFPGIDLAVGHDDNLFLQPKSGVVRGSDITVVSPYVRAEFRPGPHKFEFGLRIDDGRYHDSVADSYTDFNLYGAGELAYTVRSNLKLRAEWRHGHDARGSTDRAPSAAPDEYDNGTLEGVYTYGAAGARGRIELNGGLYLREYTNNRATTAQSDRNTRILGGTFYWRVMPRTELLAQYQHSNINYTLTTSTQDSMEDRYYLGVKWEATAATTGYAKFGQLRKNFASAGREDSRNSSWDVGVRWSPLTYSVFDFVTSTQTNESTGFGDALLSSTYGVTWSHAWSSRVRTQALANYREDKFVNAATPRTDSTSSFGLKATYEFRRWLKFGAEYTFYDRDSNLPAFDYKRNLFMLTVGAAL